MLEFEAGVFIAPGAVVIGDVVVAPGVNVWYGCVVRGDLARITLGENVNLQDGCVVHTDFDVPLDIEAGVVAGHSAILHGRRIGARTLVGMGAKILSGAEIGAECVIAAGALVPERMKVPARSVVMGVPAKVVRTVTEDDLARVLMINARYRELAARHARGDLTLPFGPVPASAWVKG